MMKGVVEMGIMNSVLRNEKQRKFFFGLEDKEI